MTVNSWGSSDPAEVAKGGTGVASHTAYSVVCGGTTGTGALQNVSGVGTSGQVLTSNGAAALPTWQAASSGGAGGIKMPCITNASITGQTYVIPIVPSVGFPAASLFGINTSDCGPGDLFFFPVNIPDTRTYNDLYIWCGTAGSAGDECEVILYDINSSGQPNNKIVETGSIDVSSSGLKTIAIDTSIDAGRYWGCILSDNNNTGSPALHGYNNASNANQFLMHFARAGNWTGTLSSFLAAGTYTIGTAPTNPTSFTVGVVTTGIPAVMIGVD